MLSTELNMLHVENLNVGNPLNIREAVKTIRDLACEYGVIKVFKAYHQIPASRHSTSVPIPSFGTHSALSRSGVDFLTCPSTGRKNIVDGYIMRVSHKARLHE